MVRVALGGLSCIAGEGIADVSDDATADLVIMSVQKTFIHVYTQQDDAQARRSSSCPLLTRTASQETQCSRCQSPTRTPTPSPRMSWGTAQCDSLFEFSLGSRFHNTGNCKPCAFFHDNKCELGWFCHFCHFCDRGEKKRRKTQRQKEAKERCRKRRFAFTNRNADD